MTDLPINRITLVTLGVADLARSRAFYAALGWQETKAVDGVVFYQMDGMVMGLFGRDELAADQGRPGAALGTGAATFAQNFHGTADVDAAWVRALDAGAKALKPPEPTLWGGYSGYFADPDGHVWELAHNPLWPLDETGRTTIPDTP
ncbi:VOC family protein [Roseibacterium sp. SDUM158017]|uniref:VOC family protein n=1 Tax=Roseicyclus salinarum TaxID=3036773 RepID=UPI0024150CCA|nr:VOC family protein [Roseibacterium sp. SDUM158017]MDG4649257.1 VOC family protein [Roseibacterium sp. SDUM158017]